MEGTASLLSQNEPPILHHLDQPPQRILDSLRTCTAASPFSMQKAQHNFAITLPAQWPFLGARL